MRLRLTGPAARQLDGALASLDRHSSQAARDVQRHIQKTIPFLLQHSLAGHATSRPGIRRIVVSPYPYALTYRVGAGEIIHPQRASHLAATARMTGGCTGRRPTVGR